ncbi:hypothetical protein ABT218_38705 [Streptomyces sp. NPDC001455]|uniref:hypothetical protein n=1 Tax=Streptomyces sp. NPDC001455 TaxID=3154518 RepID=UPI003330E5DA
MSWHSEGRGHHQRAEDPAYAAVAAGNSHALHGLAQLEQREESGYDTQDDVIERLTAIYAQKKSTAPSVAEARRGLGQ